MFSIFLGKKRTMTIDEFANVETGNPATTNGHHSNKYYDWKLYSPSDHSVLHFVRWLMVGGSAYARLSDTELQKNLESLARCLLLLRDYESRFGIPKKGGIQDQAYVLREVYRDLYAGGAPIWALEPVMEKAAEGLTGQRGVNFLLLLRKAFFFTPTSGRTSMFSTERPTDQGFCINIMDSMEPVLIRLASFASNTHGVDSVPAQLPCIKELRKACHDKSAIFGIESQRSKEELAAEILSLASDAEGLFFFLNTSETLNGSTSAAGDQLKPLPIDDFWKVKESTREVFSRLATIEAMDSINKIDADAKLLYSPLVLTIFRLCSSAGACAIWFSGSWQDMVVAGILAIVVAFIFSCPHLVKQERIIF